MAPPPVIARDGLAVLLPMAPAHANIPATSTWALRIDAAGQLTTTNNQQQRKSRMPNVKSSKSQSSGTGSSRSEMRRQIINYIRAGYPGLYLVSPEEQRVQAEMQAITK